MENKEQKYIIKNNKSFCLAHIFDCGQCFRWKKQEDGSYTGVFRNNILNVKKEKETIVFSGIYFRFFWSNTAYFNYIISM